MLNRSREFVFIPQSFSFCFQSFQTQFCLMLYEFDHVFPYQFHKCHKCFYQVFSQISNNLVHHQKVFLRKNTLKRNVLNVGRNLKFIIKFLKSIVYGFTNSFKSITVRIMKLHRKLIFNLSLFKILFSYQAVNVAFQKMY